MTYDVGDVIGFRGGLMWVWRVNEKAGTYTLIPVISHARAYMTDGLARRYPFSEVDDSDKSWFIERRLQRPQPKHQITPMGSEGPKPEPPNKKHQHDQIIDWQNQVLAGTLTQIELAHRLGVSRQRVSYLLLKAGGREYDQLKRLKRLAEQLNTSQEIAEVMELSVEQVAELQAVLNRRRHAGKSSSSSGR